MTNEKIASTQEDINRDLLNTFLLGVILISSLGVERIGLPMHIGAISASASLLMLGLLYRWGRKSNVRFVRPKSDGFKKRLTLTLLLALTPLAVMLFDAAGSSSGFADAMSRRMGDLNPSWPIILSATVIAPFAEELYFRGIFLENLRRHFGAITGVAFSSVLFGLLHLQQIGPVGAAVFAVGSAALCLCVMKTGSLGLVVQSHIAWNGAAFSLSHPHIIYPVAALVAVLAVFLFSTIRSEQPDRQTRNIVHE